MTGMDETNDPIDAPIPSLDDRIRAALVVAGLFPHLPKVPRFEPDPSIVRRVQKWAPVTPKAHCPACVALGVRCTECAKEITDRRQRRGHYERKRE